MLTPRRTTSALIAVAVTMSGCSTPTPGDEMPSASAPTTRVISSGRMFLVQGAILAKYRELGGPAGWLGDPTCSEKPAPKGGRLNEFQGGAIYWTPRTGAHSISGDILWAWMSDGGPGGALGYPTSDGHTIPGGSAVTFEHGSIETIDGRTVIHVLPAPP